MAEEELRQGRAQQSVPLSCLEERRGGSSEEQLLFSVLGDEGSFLLAHLISERGAGSCLVPHLLSL